MSLPPLHCLPRICGYLLLMVAGAGFVAREGPLGIVGAIVLALLFIELADDIKAECAREARRPRPR